ncbi:hypothetical protein Syun_022161 [Stephania yunnanensis]|uniref:U-box domain-containing protein n=1 Tax=Stephania yunnanensis TaxID=152371 RepID=A0AAP0IGY9_9MAGN
MEFETDQVSEAARETISMITSDDPCSKLQAARDIRRFTKTSHKFRRQFSDAIEPLVSMLRSDSPEFAESALLALLNLAVKDEKNKVKIINAGALNPLVGFLQTDNSTWREYATAALLTLSASAINKPSISSSGAIPLLVQILKEGSLQGKIDALMTLYNLSTQTENLASILLAKAIPPLVDLLKNCKKSSKTAEKCSALLEALLGFEEGRTALTAEEGGVLTVVEVLENGSLLSREHAVGALLTMCESDSARNFKISIESKNAPSASARLSLPEIRTQADTIENIVSNIVSQIDGEDRIVAAKKMLADMVQVSMEQSLRHLKQRALVCTPDLPLGNGASESVEANARDGSIKTGFVKPGEDFAVTRRRSHDHNLVVYILNQREEIIDLVEKSLDLRYYSPDWWLTTIDLRILEASHFKTIDLNKKTYDLEVVEPDLKFLGHDVI